jgi:hypothetical protein
MLKIVNFKKGKWAAFISILLSLSSFFIAFLSVMNKDIYNEVFIKGGISSFQMNGAIAQDIMTIFLSVVLFAFSFIFLIKKSYLSFNVIIGLTGYIFYAYGLYVIEGIYTNFYPFYLIMFSLSIYNLIIQFISFEYEKFKFVDLNKKVKYSCMIFLSSILFILAPAWISQMLSNVSNNMAGDAYAVLILDLGIFFPAIFITILLLLKNNPLGNIFSGVMLIKTVTVCIAWGFAEWFVPIYTNSEINIFMALTSSVLTIISLILFVLYNKSLIFRGVSK